MPTCSSPYDYWQYWRNTEDGDVARFLKLFTVLPLDEIGRLAALKGQEINEAKKILATEVDRAGARPRRCRGGRRDRAPHLRGRRAGARRCRRSNVPRAELDAGLGVLAAFVKAGLVTSNGEARRQIKGGGIRVNDVAVTDEKMTLTPSHLTPEGVIKLSLGRKRHVLLKPV